MISKTQTAAGVIDEVQAGPGIGEPVPDFELPNQFGKMVRFSEARGDKQALILFHRSASW